MASGNGNRLRLLSRDMGRRWVFRRTQWAVDSPIFAGEIRSVAASIHVFVASQHGRILDFMRWDLAKCEKTLMFAQNLDPQCSSQASEKHCQGETSEKNDIRLAPLIRSFVISFRGKKYSMLSVLVQQIGCKILQHLNLLCQINTKPKTNIETSNRSNLAAPCR